VRRAARAPQAAHTAALSCAAAATCTSFSGPTGEPAGRSSAGCVVSEQVDDLQRAEVSALCEAGAATDRGIVRAVVGRARLSITNSSGGP
jgi:hypothetical protein